ncbi:MAG: hemolysin family protein [Hyphomicrobiales bacterium]|nr:hemolysin family protein [Hyphomicrobiales bacterium]
MSGIGSYWNDIASIFLVDTARLLEPGMVARLVLQVFLFGCSAFFSGSETALFSLSRLDLQKLRRERHPKSETLHALLDEPRRLIISILCGNELVNIAATVNMAGILIALYGPEQAGWINIIVMFPLLLLFGEVTPKTISASNPIGISTRIVASPLALWSRIITPLRRTVRMAAGGITTWIVGGEQAPENILRVDEFRAVLEDVAEEGVLDATERVLIDNLLEAGETEIVEIMTPRTRIKFLEIETPLPEMFEQFKAFQHPRVPICHGRADNFVGFLHAEDVLKWTMDGVDLNTLRVEDVMHDPVVVPPTKNVDEMFDFFQANNARAAIVLNEFGGVDGLITMRDIIKFIFGEISESVSSQAYYMEHDDNVYEVPGDMKLTDFNDLTNFGIEDPRMTTIGGVVFRHLDRLPQASDTVVIDGCAATVLAMKGHRVAHVRVAKISDPTETPAPEPDDRKEA